MTRPALRGALLGLIGLVLAPVALPAVGRWTPLGPFAEDGSPILLSAGTVAPDGVLYASALADDTLYRSDDSRGHWLALEGLRGVNGVWCLAADPLTPSNLYAGTSAGLYRSTDSGDSFVPIWTDQVVYALTFDRSAPGTLFAATGPKFGNDFGSVFRSRDGGESWTRVLATNDPYQFASIALDPSAPSNVYAGTERGRFFRSADAGTSWTEVPGYWDGRIQSIAIDASSPSTVYAASQQTVVPMGPGIGNVVKSADFGQTWQTLSGIPRINVGGMALDPRSPSHVYAGVDGVVYASADGGVSWSPLGGDSPLLYADALLFDPLSPGHLYAVAGTIYDILLDSGRLPVEPVRRTRPRVTVLPPRR